MFQIISACIFNFQLAIVILKDLMVLLVIIMGFAIVKIILSMINVMLAVLAFLTFQHVKVSFTGVPPIAWKLITKILCAI